MGIGSAWNITPSSDAKLNYMEVISGTGAELAALDKTKHTLIRCTSTGSGFTLDHVYLCTTDGTSTIDLTGVLDHTHSGAGDGGSLLNVIGGPAHVVVDLLLTKTTDLLEEDWATPLYWNKAITSTGSVENKTDGTTGERSIKLRTGATSAATATISYPHLNLDFSEPSYFSSKIQIETATSIAAHIGVGADDCSAADSNTRKFQAEICTTVNGNWFLRTATGTANSSSDSGVAFTANRTGIGIDNRSDLGTPECDLWIDVDNVLQKTSNIAVDGATAEINLIKFSVKNNTAADRPLLTYGCRLTYLTGSNWVYRS